MKCCEFLKTKWGKVVKIAAFVLLLLLVYGIGANKGGYEPYTSSYDDYYSGYGGYGSDEGEAKMMTSESTSYDYYYDVPQAASDVSVGSTTSSDAVDFADAMVIKNGYLTIQVDSTNDSVSAISDLATSLGGYVSYSSTYENYDGSMSGSVTFRIPVGKFDEAMTGVKGMADVIDAESVDAQDVTEDYIDLQARLENKKALEEQYLAVLDTATNVTDILSVYSYIESVRSEIDSLEGQMQYYENQSSYSTVTVTLSENVSVTAPAKDWRPIQVVKEALGSWLVFLQGLVNAVIWVVVYLWPVVLIWGVWRLVRRIRRKK